MAHLLGQPGRARHSAATERLSLQAERPGIIFDAKSGPHSPGATCSLPTMTSGPSSSVISLPVGSHWGHGCETQLNLNSAGVTADSAEDEVIQLGDAADSRTQGSAAALHPQSVPATLTFLCSDSA